MQRPNHQKQKLKTLPPVEIGRENGKNEQNLSAAKLLKEESVPWAQNKKLVVGLRQDGNGHKFIHIAQVS